VKKITIVVRPDGRVSRADAAAFLGLSKKCLAERQRLGLPPRSVKVGSRRQYYLADLQAFISEGGKP
jgi:hypothetical protein